MGITQCLLCCLNGLDKVLVSFFFFFGIPKKTTSSISSDHVCNIYYYETNNFFVCLCLCKYKIELSTYGLCILFTREFIMGKRLISRFFLNLKVPKYEQHR